MLLLARIVRKGDAPSARRHGGNSGVGKKLEVGRKEEKMDISKAKGSAVNDSVDLEQWRAAQVWEHDFWIRQQKNLAKFGKNHIWRVLAALGMVEAYRAATIITSGGQAVLITIGSSQPKLTTQLKSAVGLTQICDW
jgi:hypothetical protein